MKPLNNNIQIEPQTREDFISSADTTYNEVGTVLALPENIKEVLGEKCCPIDIGDTVYFDSWMAAKYPDGKGGLAWLIPFDNIKAYEPISKEHLQRKLSPQVSNITSTQSGTSGTM